MNNKNKDPINIHYDLSLKKSTIPNAGNGLFTNNAIKKNSIITELAGKLVDLKEYSRLLEKDDIDAKFYSIAIKNKFIIPNRHETTNNKKLGHMINDIGLVKNSELYDIDKIDEYVKNIRYINCIFFPIGDKMYIKAIKNIPKNSELLTHYGTTYWLANIANSDSGSKYTEKELKKIIKYFQNRENIEYNNLLNKYY